MHVRRDSPSSNGTNGASPNSDQLPAPPSRVRGAPRGKTRRVPSERRLPEGGGRRRQGRHDVEDAAHLLVIGESPVDEHGPREAVERGVECEDALYQGEDG